MPTRTPLSPQAQRMRRCRQRQREGLLYTAGDVPLRLAEMFVEAGLLPQKDASDPRALFAALIRASERHVKKELRRNAQEAVGGVRERRKEMAR